MLQISENVYVQWEHFTLSASPSRCFEWQILPWFQFELVFANFFLIVNSWKYEKENKLMKYYANRWNIRWINSMWFKLKMMNFPLFSPARPFFPRTIIIYRNSFSDDKLNFINQLHQFFVLVTKCWVFNNDKRFSVCLRSEKHHSNNLEIILFENIK